MIDRMERLTPQAKHVFEFARQEADKARYTKITPEHLLIALSLESEGAAFLILKQLRVTEANIRSYTTETLNRVERRMALSRGTPDLSDELKTVIAQAFAEVEKTKLPYVTTDQLLLAYVRLREPQNPILQRKRSLIEEFVLPQLEYAALMSQEWKDSKLSFVEVVPAEKVAGAVEICRAANDYFHEVVTIDLIKLLGNLKAIRGISLDPITQGIPPTVTIIVERMPKNGTSHPPISDASSEDKPSTP